MNKMHGIRYLVALLCLLLALSVFAACDNGGGKTPDESTGGATSDGTTAEEEVTTDKPVTMVKINVADYTLIVPEAETENPDGNVAAVAANLLVTVQEKLGADFKAFGADTTTDGGTLEILLGATSRTESAEAMNDLGGKLGFVVKRIGDRIVINASTPALIDEAVNYFVTEYLEKGASGSFEIPEELAHADTSINGVSLLDPSTGEFAYEFVYSDKLDTSDNPTDQYDRVDYVVLYINSLCQKLMADFGGDVPTGQDSVPAKPENLEILLGDTNRPETRVFLETLAPNEYGYGVVGNKLVVTGWSDFTIAKAITMFEEDFANYLVKTAEGDNYIFLESDRTVKAYAGWDMTVPLYQSGKMTKVVEQENNSYEIYYTETTLEEYKAYCDSLVAQGYEVYQTNQIDKNVYGTYVTKSTMIHVYYVDYLKAVRFTTESRKTAVLPQNEDPKSGGEKVTDLTFTMFDLDNVAGNFGNSFIITLEDGSFILHDGGGDKGQIKNGDRDELWRLLNRLNKRKDGKIVIAAWIISHQHWDHIKNSIDMIKHYYKKGIVLERFLYNVATESVYYNSRNPNMYIPEVRNIQTYTGCDLVRMHTGQTIQIRNLKLEVLYTHEDLYPNHVYTFNNTGLVHRFDVGEGENKQRFTILGDIEDVASDIIVDMYSADALKTDIMQVAHHGGGGTVELYAAFRPTVVVWPQNQGTVTNHLKENNTSYYGIINKSLINQKNVLLLVVADNGHKTIPLPVLGLGSDRTKNHDNIVTIWPREDGI